MTLKHANKKYKKAEYWKKKYKELEGKTKEKRKRKLINYKKFTLRLPEELLDKLNKEAKKNKMNKADYLRKLLNRMLDK